MPTVRPLHFDGGGSLDCVSSRSGDMVALWRPRPSGTRQYIAFETAVDLSSNIIAITRTVLFYNGFLYSQTIIIGRTCFNFFFILLYYQILAAILQSFNLKSRKATEIWSPEIPITLYKDLVTRLHLYSCHTVTCAVWVFIANMTTAYLSSILHYVEIRRLRTWNSHHVCLKLVHTISYIENKGHIINYGGGRHVRQNSPAIFGDPPYKISMEIGDPPYLKGPWFCDPPHYRQSTLICPIKYRKLSSDNGCFELNVFVFCFEAKVKDPKSMPNSILVTTSSKIISYIVKNQWRALINSYVPTCYQHQRSLSIQKERHGCNILAKGCKESTQITIPSTKIISNSVKNHRRAIVNFVGR